MSTTTPLGLGNIPALQPGAQRPVAAVDPPHAGEKYDPRQHGTQHETAAKGLPKQPGGRLLSGGNMLVAQESRDIEDQYDLTEAEKKEIAALKKRDAEVKAHEQAHAMAGGPYAGAPTYQYENGPDGRQYAVAGHVSIDVSPVEGDPQATIEKMQVVKKAANAPVDPSAQDRSVAAKADQEIREARQELSRERTEESQERFWGGEPSSAIDLKRSDVDSVGDSDNRSLDPDSRRPASFNIVA